MLGRRITRNHMNHWYGQNYEEAKQQRNVARIQWISTKKNQDRRDYKIEEIRQYNMSQEQE